MAANDPDVRKTVASAGGRARAAKGDPAELFAIRGSGGSKANTAQSLARRIVAKWPDLSRADRAEVRAILGVVVKPPAPAGPGARQGRREDRP